MRTNAFALWGKGEGTPGASPQHASLRLDTAFAVPLSFKPTVALPKAPKVFAMGSCFAREIEAGLLRRGIEVLSIPPAMQADSDFHDKTGRYERELLNRFNLPSMELEFRNLLGGKALSDDALIVESARGTFYDAHYHAVCPLGSKAAIVERRAKMREYLAGLLDADVVVLTLGLGEACFDLAANLYRNMSPLVAEVRRSAALEVHLLGFPENLKSLRRIYDLVTRHSRRNPVFVVTVSPIPLGMTYFDDDVIVMNSASKCTLRAVAEEFVSRTERAVYYPSYEMVTLSPRGSTFRQDKRHVATRFVDYIVHRFCAAFDLETNDAMMPDLSASARCFKARASE